MANYFQGSSGSHVEDYSFACHFDGGHFCGARSHLHNVSEAISISDYHNRIYGTEPLKLDQGVAVAPHKDLNISILLLAPECIRKTACP